MKVNIVEVGYQTYLTPYVKVTTSRFLNGNYELIFGWLSGKLFLVFDKSKNFCILVTYLIGEIQNEKPYDT